MIVQTIPELRGKTVVKIVGGVGSEQIELHCADGTVFKMWHEQECCEQVYCSDITGELSSLIGEVVTLAEVRTADKSGVELSDAVGAWTFYEIQTMIDSVTIRWSGESNGFYSVCVRCEFMGAEA